MQFTDSLNENLELCRELLRGVPPDARHRAKAAAAAVEKVWNDISKSAPRDPAVALGVAFAIFVLAAKVTEVGANAEQPSLVKLLS